MRPTFGVLKGALLGGVITMIGTVLVITVAGAFVGQGLLYGLAGALYYSVYLLLLFCPVGLLVGAVIASIVIVANPRNAVQVRKPRVLLRFALLLCLFAALVLISLKLMVGTQSIVTHGARWTTDTTNTTNTSAETKCSTPVVVMMLVKYPSYEKICSAKLLSYLQAQGDTVIPIEYQVTSDFGNPGGFALIRAGTIDIGGLGFVDWHYGCDESPYLPTCDSAIAHASYDAMLTTSSWPEDAATQEAATAS